ncbi:MAG: hypothetical protein RJA44_384 [Pseudomonadota bacterium]
MDFKSIARTFFHQNFSRVFMVEGELKGCGSPFRTVMAMHPNSYSARFLLGRIYGSEHSVLSQRLLPYHGIGTLLARQSADLCIINAPARFRPALERQGALIAPDMVRQVIDLRGGIEQAKRGFRSRNRTLFNKYAQRSPFAIRVSRDVADFEYYYDRMFVPHTRKQFSHMPVIDTREALAERFAQGFLLIANRDGQDVAADLCYEQDRRLHYHRAGVLDGDEQHIQDGAQTALYVHMMLLAAERGLDYLDLGASRPFIDDGVYRHKRVWGARVLPEDSRDKIHAYLPLSEHGLTRFLRHNPMLAFEHGQHIAAHMAAEDESGFDSAEALKRCGADGVSGVHVHFTRPSLQVLPSSAPARQQLPHYVPLVCA